MTFLTCRQLTPVACLVLRKFAFIDTLLSRCGKKTKVDRSFEKSNVLMASKPGHRYLLQQVKYKGLNTGFEHCTCTLHITNWALKNVNSVEYKHRLKAFILFKAYILLCLCVSLDNCMIRALCLYIPKLCLLQFTTFQKIFSYKLPNLGNYK